MVGRLKSIWNVVVGGEVVTSLIGQATTTGGAIVATTLMNLPDWVIAVAGVSACITTGVAIQYVLAKRVVNRMERMSNRQQEAFGQLWKFAHERGLLEHVKKDAETVAQLEELRLSVYGAAPQPRGGQSKIIRAVRPGLLNPRRIRKRGRR